MARIRSVSVGSQSVSRHPSEVDCFYQVISTELGETLIHLTTFGSDDRQSEKKSSQSLQLDANAAAELIAVFHDTFPQLKR
jgi:hypothetical protein